jgi:hypothetical protein
MAARKGVIVEEEPTEEAPDAAEEAPVEVEPEVVDEASVEVEEEEDDEEEVIDLATADPNMQLWVGGPTVGQINAWKEEHEVYVTTINPYTNNHVVWRPIYRQEYRALVKQLEEAVASGMSQVEATMNNEEAMSEIVILFPTYNRHDRAGTLAGLPQLISQEAMEASGFVPAEVRQL